jgi:hypothetical protein
MASERSGGIGGGLFSRKDSSNVPTMRGLVSFIADLRNARARELEEKRINKELANIRQKFRDGGLNGYSRKKYVCKVPWPADCVFAIIADKRLASVYIYTRMER